MWNSLGRWMLGLLAALTLLAGQACADTFEFLTYTPPPGWVKQVLRDGIAYRRSSGIGLITLYASSPATGSASEEFGKMWREHIEPALPGPAPQPRLERQGDYTVAGGKRQIEVQGTMTTAALVAIVGRGRAIGVLSMAAGDEVLRESLTFFDGLTIAAGAPAAAAPGSGPVPPGEIEVDFEVPPGYVSQRDGPTVVLTPKSADEKTAAVYGVSPARPSRGTLEADARAAILEVLPGWQLKSDHYNAMRGTAGAGWPYFWFRADVQRLVGTSYEYTTAMTMAFPAGPGRVNIVWGMGNPARCTLDDLTFVRLFHSLRPRGWSSDGGKQLSRDLQGTWRNSQSAGMAQYRFLANRRYEFGIGTTTTTGLLERTSSSVSDGRYELRGADLSLTADRRDRGITRYRVRIYEEFTLGRWTRAMSLLDEGAKPALEVQYLHVEDSR